MKTSRFLVLLFVYKLVNPRQCFSELINGCKLQPSRLRPNAFLVEQIALSEEHEENEEHNQRFSPDLRTGYVLIVTASCYFLLLVGIWAILRENCLICPLSERFKDRHNIV